MMGEDGQVGQADSGACTYSLPNLPNLTIRFLKRVDVVYEIEKECLGKWVDRWGRLGRFGFPEGLNGTIGWPNL